MKVRKAYTHAESGLCLLTYRYYSPVHGTFLTRDPSGAELQLYAYARQNPVTGHDPSGLADIIAVPGLPGFPDHEYVEFNLIKCQIPGHPCKNQHNGSSYGFWPAVSPSMNFSSGYPGYTPGQLNQGGSGNDPDNSAGGTPASGLQP